MARSLVVGIAGGTGSGKSTLAAGLQNSFPGGSPIFHLDDYFIAKADMPVLAGESNYDNPASIDQTKLVRDIRQVLSAPNPPRLIIVEGFLSLYLPELRKLLDIKIFLKTPFNTLVSRRVHPMWENYRQHVLMPMYNQYVLPSATYADVILDVHKESQVSVLEKTIRLVTARSAIYL